MSLEEEGGGRGKGGRESERARARKCEGELMDALTSTVFTNSHTTRPLQPRRRASRDPPQLLDLGQDLDEPRPHKRRSYACASNLRRCARTRPRSTGSVQTLREQTESRQSVQRRSRRRFRSARCATSARSKSWSGAISSGRKIWTHSSGQTAGEQCGEPAPTAVTFVVRIGFCEFRGGGRLG